MACFIVPGTEAVVTTIVTKVIETKEKTADAIFEYAELRAAYFTPTAQDMLNDSFLGLSVIALALVVWVIVLLIKDPKRVIKKTLKKNS
jgi:hypothetical protein